MRYFIYETFDSERVYAPYQNVSLTYIMLCILEESTNYSNCVRDCDFESMSSLRSSPFPFHQIAGFPNSSILIEKRKETLGPSLLSL